MKKTILFFSSLFLFLFSQLLFAQTHTGIIEFTNDSQAPMTSYPTGPIYILLEDVDLDLDGTLNTATVNITSSTESTSETVLLTETGANSGIFTGFIEVEEGGTPTADGELEVNVGDDLLVSYADQADDFGQDTTVVKDYAVYGFTEIAGARYKTNTTWSLSESPYLVTGDVYVWDSVGVGGVTLTIEAGVEVRFLANTDKTESGYNIGISEFRFGNGGILNAVGTETLPIKFTTQSNLPEAGQWYGITIGYQGQSTIEYAEIEYARTGVAFSSPYASALENSTIKNSQSSGVSIGGGEATELNINQNDVMFFGSSGIYLSGVGSLVEVSNNSIENSTADEYGIYLDGSSAKIIANSITTAEYGIRLYDGALPISIPEIKNNTIESTNRGIVISGNYMQPVINYNNLANNTQYGLGNYGEREINAKSNWWGEAATGEMDGRK